LEVAVLGSVSAVVGRSQHCLVALLLIPSKVLPSSCAEHVAGRKKAEENL
jgi:hypothetical protein